jgi:hypothetical protein
MLNSMKATYRGSKLHQAILKPVSNGGEVKKEFKWLVKFCYQ